MPQYRNIPFNSACHSTVAEPGGRVLCVGVPELAECGVSEKYLWKSLSQHRTGLVYCWPHHKEGREVFVHYDGMGDKYKALVNKVLCEDTDAHLWVQNMEAAALNKKLSAVKRSLSGMVEVSAADMSELTQMQFFVPSDVQRIARAAGWMRLWRRMDVKTARKYGFTSVREIQEELFKQCLNEQIKGFVKFAKPINSERTLDRKAREYGKEGLSCLVGGYFGNVNREKMNTQTHAILMQLASDPVKYSFEDIGMYYNEQAEELGLPKMTVSAIKQHLNTPKHKKVWYYMRHGKLVGDLDIQPMIDREPVSKPDLLWSLDGTTMQLYYRRLEKDKRGNDKWVVKSDLYAYFVTDACTGAIIGHSVAFSESSSMVIEALRNTVNTWGYIPYQMNYDNGSANIETTVKALVDNMTRVNFPCSPYSGRSKTVESVIGHFQQRELRKLKNFKGGNITTKSHNSTANPELLKELAKDLQFTDKLPTEEQVLCEFREAVEAWNKRGEGRDAYGTFIGKSKIERYAESYEGRVKLNAFEKMSLFVVELKNRTHPFGEYEYRQKGIEISIRGEKMKFIVPDCDSSAMDFEFNREHLGDTFRVFVNLTTNRPEWVELRDRNGKFVADAYEKEKLASCVADMKDKPGEMGKVQYAIGLQKDYYEDARTEMERQREIAQQAGFRATGTDGYGFSWQDTPKVLENARNNRLEDKRNGFVQKSDEEVEIEGLMGM
ncbi:integrase catalytic domain-containing protein [Bacteroides neonati]|uniref:integrase catalytic domain-containing protein n=1 Tax=Bacteroides neonati TaxID=1347393 RepID=UPI0009DDF332|nr:DDE-type integrase/transposase/recombinase [Bacteroides neonati]